MNIKTKLRLGFGLLFVIIIILTGMSAYYLTRLSKDAEVILKDNYESVQFSRKMLVDLGNDQKALNTRQLKAFENELLLQENNITEPGEAKLTGSLRYNFEQLQGQIQLEKKVFFKQKIRENIDKIMDINMQAIVKKNATAQQTAKNATLYLAFWGCFCLLVAFSFIVNFPSYIANPIKQLSNGIKDIAAKKYGQRLQFKANDEFGDLASNFNIMAQKLNEYENSNLAKIMFEKIRIEKIIATMNDGVIGLDENKNILFVNPVALNLFGLKEDELLNKYAPDVALKNDLLRSLLAHQNQKEIKIFADNKESFFNKEVLDIVVPDNYGMEERAFITTNKSVGTVIVLKNITSFHELDEAKTNFIATISHELKTPISAIKMSLKLLNNPSIGNLNTEQKDLLTNIADDSNRLLKITGELLDLAQVETGNIQLNFLQTNPQAIVNYAIDAVKVSAVQKEVNLILKISDKLPQVNADLEKTAWVLVNFLSNAIRYSYQKSVIDIEIVLRNNQIYFSVQDYGKGIEPQYLSKLFDRFFQVPTDGQNKSGTGLGLAISKDFIEAQQGEIFVESEIGTGSKFGFWLPVVGITNL
ncbi:MAG: HAMP domain-containing protein [Sphingobacteriales bacterium]|nr:MAG: HAMP domain-containing protein [Sphingobacteriales bacterium]TAF83455.1 MAG: HAMP domain-containing protein [Sphingobacteriales bacterium]